MVWTHFGRGHLSAVCLGLAMAAGPAAAQDDLGPFMPHQGLQLTTAFTNSYGPDAESTMVITAVTPTAMDIAYSSSRGMVANRAVRMEDREDARVLVLGFSNKMPVDIPGTTLTGISSVQLTELRSNGQTAMGLVYDSSMDEMNGQLTLVNAEMKMPVLIENQVVNVRAIHAQGVLEKGGRQATGEFYFLDSQQNPLMLQYSIKFNWEDQPRTEKIVHVTAGRSELSKMEQALKTIKAYDVYGIHFGFDKANILPTSRGLVDEIATTLKNNPLWRLRIVGHTDSIGQPAYNMTLSEERAQSVKADIVRRGISADRLETAGAGQTEPKADNDTLQGRAINRRVELRRIDN